MTQAFLSLHFPDSHEYPPNAFALQWPLIELEGIPMTGARIELWK